MKTYVVGNLRQTYFVRQPDRTLWAYRASYIATEDVCEEIWEGNPGDVTSSGWQFIDAIELFPGDTECDPQELYDDARFGHRLRRLNPDEKAHMARQLHLQLGANIVGYTLDHVEIDEDADD